jgi:ribosomal protein S18 acetylase RimI-like enzyme
MLRAATAWARAAVGGRSWSRDGLFCSVSAARMRSFNQLFVTSPAVDREALREGVASYAGRRFRLRLREELDEPLRQTLESCGLIQQGGIPCLAFSPGDQSLESPPSGDSLRIEPVSGKRTLEDHVRIVAEAFDAQPDELGRVFTPALLADEAWSAWVGYEGTTAVATTQLVVHENTGGLYYVGVVDAARRKGYGEAITRHAVRAAMSRGCDLASLQASPMGRPVYERLGFRVICEYVTYVSEDSAND